MTFPWPDLLEMFFFFFPFHSHYCSLRVKIYTVNLCLSKIIVRDILTQIPLRIKCMFPGNRQYTLNLKH